MLLPAATGSGCEILSEDAPQPDFPASLGLHQNIQSDIAVLKTDIAVLKENTGKIDLRLKIVESHMIGFMSSAKYLEHEIDPLRGRVEALGETGSDDPPR